MTANKTITATFVFVNSAPVAAAAKTLCTVSTSVPGPTRTGPAGRRETASLQASATAEPAGATALAGLAAAVEKGLVQPEERVVCLVTGNGFKDLKSIEGIVGDTPIPLIEGDEI